jgi:hypothetical protein
MQMAIIAAGFLRLTLILPLSMSRQNSTPSKPFAPFFTRDGFYPQTPFNEATEG